MTRAEEFQNSHKQLYKVDSYPIEVVKELERNAYIAGQKATIEHACDYLHEHRQGNRDVYQFVGLFRVAMEEDL